MDATSKIQHRIDLINIAFLYLPRISERFKEDYINKGQNDIFQYNYQDRLIINMGYSYNYNSVGGAIVNNTIASNSYSIRFNFESAGNIMYALSKMTGIRKTLIMSMPFLEYLMHNISRESLTSLKISGLTIVIHLHFMPV